MLEKIEDIKKALEAKAYLSALALALTLPDICGKIEYPEMKKLKKNGERYAKWFDEHITKNDYPDEFENKFDGKKCWKLRCALLHEGAIGNIPNVISFGLCVNGASGFSMLPLDGNHKFSSIELNVEDLCTQLCCCAEVFYNQYENKVKFEDHIITIVDIGAEYRRISGMNYKEE